MQNAAVQLGRRCTGFEHDGNMAKAPVLVGGMVVATTTPGILSEIPARDGRGYQNDYPMTQSPKWPPA